MNAFKVKFTGGRFAGKEIRCASLVTVLDLWRGRHEYRKTEQDPRDPKHHLLMERRPLEGAAEYQKIADIYLDE